MADTKLVIPEYKIELLNKSKKVINTYDNIDKINIFKDRLENKIESKINLKKSKKTKIVKKQIKNNKTLWIRRKKRA